MNRSARIGTRGSLLAMYQATLVQAKLKESFPLLSFEIVKIKTSGDMIRRGGLSSIGRGIFTREIEDALLAGEIDFAVHSAKDMETTTPEGLTIAAILEREDARDSLITIDGRKFRDLTRGAKVGTSSLRRKAQLRKLRPDLDVVEIRGNVETRVRKLDAGEYEGIVMAAAGLNRLGFSARISETFDGAVFLPQAAQGAIALQVRSNDEEARTMAACLNHEKSRIQVEGERSFLKALHGGCQVPIGVRSWLDGKILHLGGAIFSLDGSREVRAEQSMEQSKANELGLVLAEQLLASGGRELLDEVRRAMEGA